MTPLWEKVVRSLVREASAARYEPVSVSVVGRLLAAQPVHTDDDVILAIAGEERAGVLFFNAHARRWGWVLVVPDFGGGCLANVSEGFDEVVNRALRAVGTR